MSDSPITDPMSMRGPRAPLPGRFFIDGSSPTSGIEIWTGAWCVAAVLAFIGVVGYHTSLYSEAKVPDVAFVGPAFIQVTVAGALLAAATLWRWGHALLSVLAATGVGLAIAVGSGLLPHLILDRSWVATLLGTLFSLAFFAASAAAVASIALYAPTWWRGWHIDGL